MGSALVRVSVDDTEFEFQKEVLLVVSEDNPVCVCCGGEADDVICRSCADKAGDKADDLKSAAAEALGTVRFEEAELPETAAPAEPVVVEDPVPGTEAVAPETVASQLAEAGPEPKKGERINVRLTVDEGILADMMSGKNKALCPIIADGHPCGEAKDEEHLVGSACHGNYGWIARNVVKGAMERAKNRIDSEVFGQLIGAAKKLIEVGGQDDAIEDKDLVAYLKTPPAERPGVTFPDFSALPFGAVFNAVRVARKAVAADREHEAKANNNTTRWEWTISQIKAACPEGEPCPADFKGLVHETGPISEGMVFKACKEVWAGRWEAWGKEAMDKVGQPAVRKAFPERIDLDHFTPDVIKELGLKYQGKFLTEKMMRRCCFQVIDERKRNAVHDRAQKAFGGGSGGLGLGNKPHFADRTDRDEEDSRRQRPGKKGGRR